MLTYQIKSHKEPVNIFVSKLEIMEKQLNNCHFKVGDRVRFKKPKRNPVYGSITHIEECWDLVTWTHGGLIPCNISITIEPSAGKEIKSFNVKTNMKRIIHAAPRS